MGRSRRPFAPVPPGGTSGAQPLRAGRVPIEGAIPPLGRTPPRRAFQEKECGMFNISPATRSPSHYPRRFLIYARLSRISLRLHIFIVLAYRAEFRRIAQLIGRRALGIYPFIGGAARRWPRGTRFGCPAKFERPLGVVDQILVGGLGLAAGDLLVQPLHGRGEEIPLFPCAALVGRGAVAVW